MTMACTRKPNPSPPVNEAIAKTRPPWPGHKYKIPPTKEECLHYSYVHHTFLGYGSIREIRKGLVYVKFNSESKEIPFPFPSVFATGDLILLGGREYVEPRRTNYQIYRIVNGKIQYVFSSIASAASVAGNGKNRLICHLKAYPDSTKVFGVTYAYSSDYDKFKEEACDKPKPGNSAVPISAFLADGTFVDRYPSITAASKALGVAKNRISKVLAKCEKSAGGYLFTFGENPPMQKDTDSKAFTVPVNMYSMSGEFEQSFSSISAAAQAVGSSSGVITRAVNQGTHYSNGHFWYPAKGDDGSRKTVSAPKNLRKERAVALIDPKTNEVVKIYSSPSQAANALGCSTAMILYALSGKRKTAKGYRVIDATFRKENARLQ